MAIDDGSRTEVLRLLSFAARSRAQEGFGYLLADGSLDASQPLQVWITARMTHAFSLAVLFDGHRWLPLVEHGLAALHGRLRDDESGGWRTPGTRTKVAYDHAFVLLAAASASQARATGADELLEEALRVWDKRFWDPVAGACVDSWDAAWSQMSTYRGANANMHGVEAMLAAADVLEHRAPDLHERALQATARFVHREARSRGWRLPEHFDEQWQVDLHYHADHPADPFQPFGVTVGHQFEWARLTLQLAAALGPTAPSWLHQDAEALYAAARDRGWAADDAPGFVYTLDWDDRPVVRSRLHWVQAEAIAAAGVLSRVTGSPSYGDDLTRWLEHARQVFRDPTTGSWHHELDAAGAPSTDTWHGQPDAYHVLQALLLPQLPVAGSAAQALRLLQEVPC